MPKPETSRDFRYSRNSSRSLYEGNVLQTRIALRELTQELQSFTNIISHAQPLERASLTVPIQLNRAWIYLILALAKATRKSMVRNAHFDNAKDLIKEGMAEVMQALPSEDLLAREVVLPLEIVSLLSLKLLQDTTGTYPNLDTIYSEYLNALVSQSPLSSSRNLCIVQSCNPFRCQTNQSNTGQRGSHKTIRTVLRTPYQPPQTRSNSHQPRRRQATPHLRSPRAL